MKLESQGPAICMSRILNEMVMLVAVLNSIFKYEERIVHIYLIVKIPTFFFFEKLYSMKSSVTVI